MNASTIIAKINKEYGANSLGFANELKYSDVPRLSSGSLFLDWALGTNIKDASAGFPMGRIVELYGPESSGKTMISLKTIAEAQKKQWLCAYFDVENAFDTQYAEVLGVDTKKLLITRESRAQKLFEMANDLLENQEVKVIIFDSLASMIPLEEIDKDLEENTMALMARVMSRSLRKLTHFNKNNTLIIFINQLRENPGATYGNPEYTPGGRALKFYASARLEIRKGEWLLSEQKEKIGHVVKFKATKNKTDIPLREGYFKFLYTGHLEKVDELVSLAILQEKIQRSGSYYSFGKSSFQGREAMENKLKENPTLFEELQKEVFSQ